MKGMKEESGGKKVDQFWEIFEREKFVFDSLIYLEPVDRFKNRSSVMKFRSFGDSTNSRVKDKLKTRVWFVSLIRILITVSEPRSNINNTRF